MIDLKNALKKKPTPFILLGLVILMLAIWATSTQTGGKAVLVIPNCINQDRTPIPSHVDVICEGIIKRWEPGKTIEFEVPLKEPRDVFLIADAGLAYQLQSLDPIKLRPGKKVSSVLEFKRLYIVRFKVVDPDDKPVPSVTIYLDGEEAGQTDSAGELEYIIHNPDLQAGSEPSIRISHPEYVFAGSGRISLSLAAKQYDYSIILPLTAAEKRGGLELTQPEVEPRPPSSAYEIEVSALDMDSKQPLPDVQVLLGTQNLGTTNSKGILRKKIAPIQENSLLNITLLKSAYKVAEMAPPNPVSFQPQKKYYSVQASLLALRRLDVSVNPPGAQITLTAKESEARTFGTDQPIYLEPDLYKYIIKKTGYQSVESKGYELNLLTTKSQRLRRTLLPEGKSGLEAWESVAPPRSGESYTDFVKAQDSIAAHHFRREDYGLAIDAWNQALQYDKRGYSRYYNLGVAYYKDGKYEDAIETLNNLERLKTLIPLETWKDMRLNILYIQGDSRYRMWDRESEETVKRDLAILANTALQLFIDQVPENNARFRAKRNEATKKKTQIDDELNQE